MSVILDLHIHSRYSRACSPQISLSGIESACRRKGVDIVASGDFTFPAWFDSMVRELEETASGSGLYRRKESPDDWVKFIIGTEISLVYKDGDKARRIHLVLHAPNLEAAAELNKILDKRFNIRSDGRPILGISAPEFVRLVLAVNPDFLVYPAHIWTPWYSVFGSKSGFDSLEECFHDQTEYIYAFETGLSSDPAMNWRLSALDKLTLLSSSDAHSLANIAREANIMELEGVPTYRKIYDNIKNKKGMVETLEFYPEEGMYHLDGHRLCAFCCEPAQSRRLSDICPVCHKPLVIGVLNRVEALSDRPLGFRPSGAPGFKKIVELDKIIADAWGVKGRKSRAVQAEYHRLTDTFGSELHILLDLDLKAVGSEIDFRICEGIQRSREGRIQIEPGFDGQYGRVSIFTAESRPSRQANLL